MVWFIGLHNKMVEIALNLKGKEMYFAFQDYFSAPLTCILVFFWYCYYSRKEKEKHKRKKRVQSTVISTTRFHCVLYSIKSCVYGPTGLRSLCLCHSRWYSWKLYMCTCSYHWFKKEIGTCKESYQTEAAYRVLHST